MDKREIKNLIKKQKINHSLDQEFYINEDIFELKGIRVPVMVSGTITDESGRTLSGQTAEAFLKPRSSNVFA